MSWKISLNLQNATEDYHPWIQSPKSLAAVPRKAGGNISTVVMIFAEVLDSFFKKQLHELWKAAMTWDEIQANRHSTSHQPTKF